MASKSDNNKRVIYIVGAAPILVELANNSKSDDELKGMNHKHQKHCVNMV